MVGVETEYEAFVKMCRPLPQARKFLARVDYSLTTELFLKEF